MKANTDEYLNKWKPLLIEFQASGLSAYRFCLERGVNNSNFYLAAKNLGFEVRINRGKVLETLDNRELTLLDAHLLGDGTLVYTHPKKNKNPSFVIISKHKEYLNWLTSTFKLLEGRSIWDRNVHDPRTDKTYSAFWVKSRSYSYLIDQHKRWYPNGKKIVPLDIQINPELLLHWYLDDGSPKATGIYLSTDCFTEEEVQFLISKIKEATGLKVTAHKNGKGYRTCVCNKREFLKIIGPCPVDCFQYKWSNEG